MRVRPLTPLVLNLLAGPAMAGSFTLARDGRPAATIVIAAEPTIAAEFAAAELQAHVHRITGALLPIATDAQSVAGPRIAVGDSRLARALGIRAEALRSQEYVIRFRPEALVLLGRDDADAAAGGSLPARAPGKFGGALQFDGVRQVFVDDDVAFNDERGTLEAWVYLPAEKPDQRHGTILRLDGSDPWTYHIIQRDVNTSCISYTTYDGARGHGLRSGELSEGWHHVVGTYDATTATMELWIDGVKQGSTDYVKTTCRGAPLGIGAMAAPFGNPLQGRIDEVRISTVVRDVPREADGGPYVPDDGTVALYHCDEPRGAPVNEVKGVTAATPPPLFGDHATLDAVYDFLERFCDVRWYAPTELGTVCLRTPTLVVSGKDIRRAPAMVHRWITPTPLYLPGPPDRVPARDVHLWKLRMRIGGQAFWVCHSFYGYYDRFLTEHPDWFAQGYEGQPPQMCYTHPGFIAQVVQDARDYFDGKGKQPGATAEGDVFGLVPQDNMSWCRCPRCQAQLNAAERDNPQFNNGKASDYIWRFVNTVAAEVRKTHPDKWIGALAYSDYAYYPTGVRLEPNIVVQMCLHTRNWWCPSMEANDRKVLAEWRAREPNRPLYLWLYYCFPALNAKYGQFHYFPGFFAHDVMRQMRLYHDARIQGIFMEHSSECGESYLMDQLEFYLTLKLADDPSLDPQALFEEFFTRYYGHAAEPMKALYLGIEEAFSNPAGYPPEIRDSPAHQHQTEELAWGCEGTPERMARFAELMAAAEAAARTPEEQARVALFRRGLWDYMVEGRRLYESRAEKRAAPTLSLSVPSIPEAGGELNRVDFASLPVQPGWGGLSGDPTDRRIELRVAHDATHLYFQLTEWLDPRTLVPGGQIWDGDDWELFFAPARGASYRQLCIAPDGRVARLRYGEPEGPWELGEQILSNTGRPDCWIVRLALPLDRLLPAPLSRGARLYANVYRASPNATRLLAWAPNFANGFHDTTRLPALTLE